MSGTGITCVYCGRSFTARKSLYAHQRKFHQSERVEFRQNSLICCFCDDRFYFMRNLHSHMQKQHADINLDFKEKIFYSDESFEKWKADIERNSQSHFSKQNGERVLSDGRVSMIFHCNRSGSFIPKTDRKRRIKSIGTQKMGKTCPAYISAHKQTINEAVEIVVKYQSIHVGHKKEIERIGLSRNEKGMLAGQMGLGVSKSSILSNIAKNFSPTILITEEQLVINQKLLKANKHVSCHDNAMKVQLLLKQQNLITKSQSDDIPADEFKIIYDGIKMIETRLDALKSCKKMPMVIAERTNQPENTKINAQLRFPLSKKSCKQEHQ